MRMAQIEYFLAVAQHLNFTAAAKSLYVSQPALSKQIALLEEEVGTRLFIRNSRKVALTAAGMQLEHDLKEINRQIEWAKRNACEIGKQDKPVFRIGCFDGLLTADFLPALFAKIQEVDPKIETLLTRGSYSENKKALECEGVDLLLVLDIEWEPDDRYKVKVIHRRKGALIYSVNSPLAKKEHLTVQDFAGENLLIPRQKENVRMFRNAIKNLKHLGIETPRYLEMDNMATLSAYLEIGRGYAILSEHVIDCNPMLRKLDVPVDEMEILAVWKRNHALTDLLMEDIGGK